MLKLQYSLAPYLDPGCTCTLINVQTTLVRLLQDLHADIAGKWPHAALEITLTCSFHSCNIVCNTPAGMEELQASKPEDIGKMEIDGRWYCSVCRLEASSEANLNQHLYGKGHKTRVKCIRAQEKEKEKARALAGR